MVTSWGHPHVLSFFFLIHLFTCPLPPPSPPHPPSLLGRTCSALILSSFSLSFQSGGTTWLVLGNEKHCFHVEIFKSPVSNTLALFSFCHSCKGCHALRTVQVGRATASLGPLMTMWSRTPQQTHLDLQLKQETLFCFVY
jgi:hypothetical protein